MADPKEVRYVSPNTFYGDILAARQAHESVAQMWDRIHATLDTFNTPDARYEYRFDPSIFDAINHLSADAAGVRSAQELLGRASSSDALTGSMIGRPFYGRSPTEQEAFAKWEGRVELLMQRPEGLVSQWITVDYTAATLPGTVGQLQDDLEGFAQEWAGNYEGTLVGTGSVMLNAI